MNVSKIDLIIFSKNRPLQLECLLRSIQENTNIFNTINIQYFSDDFFYKGYQSIIQTFTNVIFNNENKFGFKNTFLNIVSKSNQKICIMVDDDIVFREIKHIPNSEIFSLRLGKNIKNSKHFEYSGSLDGNIFDKKFLIKLDNKNFTNPNKLEISLCEIVKKNKMEYFDESKLIGIPNNKVSKTSRCSDMGQDIILLNEIFNSGKRIDYKKMNLNHDDVHKYINYIYF